MGKTALESRPRHWPPPAPPVSSRRGPIAAPAGIGDCDALLRRAPIGKSKLRNLEKEPGFPKLGRNLYDIDAVLEWLKARGNKPASWPARPDAETSALLRRAGLRAAGGR